MKNKFGSLEKKLINVKTIEELRELCRKNQAEVEALLDENSCYKSLVSLHQKLTGLPDSFSPEERLIRTLFNPEKRFNDVLKDYMFSVYDKACALEREFDGKDSYGDIDIKHLTELGKLLEKCHDKIICTRKEELENAAKEENSPDLEKAVANLCNSEEYFRKYYELCQTGEENPEKFENLKKEYEFIELLRRHFGNDLTVKSDKINTKIFTFNDLFIADNIKKIKLSERLAYGITREKVENTEIALVEIIIPDYEHYINDIPFAWYNPKDKTIFVNNTSLANSVGFILDKVEQKKDKLLCKEFENKSMEEIYDSVFFRAAIHELGHQANDLSYYLSGEHFEWEEIDNERFSKLCELIYGKAEYLSLFDMFNLSKKEKYNFHKQANESIRQEIFNILESNKSQYQKIDYANLREKTEDEFVKLSRQEIRDIATQIMEKFEAERKEYIRTGFENLPGSLIYRRKMELKSLHEQNAARAVIDATERTLQKRKQAYKEIYESLYGK